MSESVHQWEVESSPLRLQLGQTVTLDGGEQVEQHSVLFLPFTADGFVIVAPTTTADFNEVAVAMVANFVQGWAAAALFTLLLLALVMLHGFIVRGRRAGGL